MPLEKLGSLKPKSLINLSTENEKYSDILREGILTPLSKPPNKKENQLRM